jgi:peroxiredoxin
LRLIFSLSLLLFLAACGPADPEAPVQASAPVEDWLLEIQLPDVVLPVQMHIAADASEAWFVNGGEIVHVPEISVNGSKRILRFPAFNNTVELEIEGDRLSGSLTLVKRGYEQHMALSGSPYPGYRFSHDADAEVDVTGRWAVVFTSDEGEETHAVGEFDQQQGRITGTFLTPTGDYRYLSGEVDGTTVRLSTFDGAHAYVFTATALPDGSLDGDWWSGTSWHEDWIAVKDFGATLPDAYSLTHLKQGYESLEFSFPDLEGQAVSLADDRFQGKVVLVTLSGTWCPNCADEVEFLAGFFDEHRGRGLEIITLLYEHFEDFETAAAQGRALKKKHGINFDVVVAGMSDKTLAAETLPMLNHVLAFPTMIFIDRTGSVRKIHTGFAGPGTGSHYQQFVEEFKATMDELLSE